MIGKLLSEHSRHEKMLTELVVCMNCSESAGNRFSRLLRI